MQNLAKHNRDNIQRRQFNCPEHGIFFKKVPAAKPVAKCAQCVARGDTNKLVAVPREAEKGFGLFKCNKCSATWGSSKACRGLGQFCESPSCIDDNVPQFPFKIIKEKRYTRKNRRRPPPMATPNEEEEADFGYDGGAQNSAGFGGGFASGGGFAGGSGGESNWRDGDGAERSDRGERDDDYGAPGRYPEQSQQRDGNSSANGGEWQFATGGRDKKSRHRCTGCASGLCKSRDVPLSVRHFSTGSTASTCSEKTWSTTSGLGQYHDRDRESDTTSVISGNGHELV